MRIFGIMCLVAFSLTGAYAQSATATIDWMECAYEDGAHNAFTDLVRWKGQYYLCFRAGEGHVSMDGVIIVMRSDDMKTWTRCARIATLGDDRDPHFTVTGERLYVYFGVWDTIHKPGAELVDRHQVRSAVSATRDGREWTKPKAIYEPGWWVWRVREHEGRFYGLAYSAFRPAPKVRELHLVQSDDALNWEHVSFVADKDGNGESDMIFQEDGSIWAVTRTTKEAMLSKSDPERTTWENTRLGAEIHSPALVEWKGRLFCAGRSIHDGDRMTSIWEIVDGKAVELIVLPSGRDTAYPGLILDPATTEADTPAFFVSWYSQHETKGHKSNIYVARVALNE